MPTAGHMLTLGACLVGINNTSLKSIVHAILTKYFCAMELHIIPIHNLLFSGAQAKISWKGGLNFD